MWVVGQALPKQISKVKHRKALPWQEMPGFATQLVKREAASAKTLLFLMLTVDRSSEVRLARPREIDNGVWTVPA